MSELAEAHTNILNNNKLKKFLLKIDFVGGLTIDGISSAIQDMYERKEVHEISGVNVHVETQNGSMTASASEAPKRAQHVFVLGKNANMIFQPDERTLVIHSNVYRNNSIYKSIIQKISDAFPDCMARRIGLRYINVFDCARVSDISSVLKAPYATMVKNLLREESITRAVCVTSEMSDTGNACNIQFGVPNECYPGKRVNNAVLLDIDSYVIGDIVGKDWPLRIRDLNHAAYERFRYYVADRQIEKMV